jgi:hypothetical protein
MSWSAASFNNFRTTYQASHQGHTATRVQSKKKVDTFEHSAPFVGESTSRNDFHAYTPAQMAKGRGRPVQSRSNDATHIKPAKFTATSTYSHEIVAHPGNHRAVDRRKQSRQYQQRPDTRDWKTDYATSFQTHADLHKAKGASCKPVCMYVCVCVYVSVLVCLINTCQSVNPCVCLPLCTCNCDHRTPPAPAPQPTSPSQRPLPRGPH